MDNDHGITGELRDWAKTLTRWWYDPVKNEYTYTSGTMPPSIDAIRLDSNILAIADRIDAEHESACGEAYGNGVMSVPIALDESQWVKLPVDADGVPIRVGDVVDVTQTDKFTGHKNVVVTSVIFKRSAALVTVDTTDRPFTFRPNRIRHHHAPTVEDVLREFAAKLIERSGLTNGAAQTIAEYAAKLRLAGDAE